MNKNKKITIATLAKGAIEIGSAIINTLSVGIGIPSGTALENHQIMTTAGAELVNRALYSGKNIEPQNPSQDQSDEIIQ